MCGRYVSASSAEAIAEYLDAHLDAEPLDASYNVAPTDDVYAVVADRHGGRAIRTYQWGLVPSWADDRKIGARMINARAETLRTSNAFKRSFASRRALVPMDGFYEWRVVPAAAGAKPSKQPVHLHRPNGEPFAVAGLWAAWHDPEAPDDEWLHSCTVITTTPNRLAATVHDRMPAILPKRTWDRWLDPDNHDLAELMAMLGPAPESLLVADDVAPLVNDVRNDGPELVVPIRPPAP
jgi:putative SOS response-associated peptidase YedK